MVRDLFHAVVGDIDDDDAALRRRGEVRRVHTHPIADRDPAAGQPIQDPPGDGRVLEDDGVGIVRKSDELVLALHLVQPTFHSGGPKHGLFGDDVAMITIRDDDERHGLSP